jgi:hypothetical protein
MQSLRGVYSAEYPGHPEREIGQESQPPGSCLIACHWKSDLITVEQIREVDRLRKHLADSTARQHDSEQDAGMLRAHCVSSLPGGRRRGGRRCSGGGPGEPVYAMSEMPVPSSEWGLAGADTTLVTPPLWPAVGRLLEMAPEEGVVAHRLAPLAAVMCTRSERAIPAAWLAKQREAAIQMIAAVPVLRAVRASCEGPVVLMKGPEVALRYPETARSFGDLDLLVPNARTTHEQLKENGFVEVGDPALYYRLHHLRPLAWPGLPLAIEIHSAPKWPEGLDLAPMVAPEVIESALPSGLGVDGILAPEPGRHALLLAAHSWAHEPFRLLRDLVDVAAMGAEADPSEMARIARAWEIDAVWRTTSAVAAALFEGGPRPVVLRLWARHLAAVRERTVLEGHLQKWLSGFWVLPTREALGQSLGALGRDLLRAPEEGWRAKLSRTLTASRHALVARSRHDLHLGEEATRGRGRNPPDDDDLPIT